MCFNDRDTYTTRAYVRNGVRYEEEYSRPRHGMSWRRKHGFGGSYYPSRYYTRRPTGRYITNAHIQPYGYPGYSNYSQGVMRGGYVGYSSGYGPYFPDNRVAMPRHAAVSARHLGLVTQLEAIQHSCLACAVPDIACRLAVYDCTSLTSPRRFFSDTTQSIADSMEAYPKPRHQYIYNPRYGQRGVLTYAGQQANGAPPTGVMPNGGVGVGYYGAGIGGVAAGGYYPGVYPSRPLYSTSNYYSGAYYNSYSPYISSYAPYSSYSPYGGYYNYNMYGSLYPLANFYSPYQRSYYNTVPSYGYAGHYGYGMPATQAYVCPPGPTTTTTTTYRVMNGHSAPPPAATTTGHCHHGAAPTREDYQAENRRVAAERGAYAPKPIKPADARSDDPFWCRERTGEWHLRSYYQIENECYPGSWKMDAEAGFLIFQRA